MIKTQGTDSTLEPAYFAIPPTGSSSSSDAARIARLEVLVQELQNTVNGTAAESYTDGLVSKVEELKRIVDELVISSNIKIYYDTTANWNTQRQLVAERGAIYIYSDAKTYEGVPLPRLKIGDGNAYLVDLMFIDQDIVDIVNNYVSVTQEEKDKWNNKISCQVEDEKLIFSTN